MLLMYIHISSNFPSPYPSVLWMTDTHFYEDTESAGAIYTQTTDVEGEVNGLMTYDRKVIKLDVDRIKAINSKVIASMTE